MKKLILMLILAFTLPLFSSCKSEEPIETPFEDEMPEPFDFPEPSGPEALGDFRSRYNDAFSNLDSAILNLADNEECNNWLNEKFIESLFDPYAEDVTVLSFAKRFDIPKEKLIEAVEGADYESGWTVSPEDIEIIYSGDKELINKTFANEYALVNGENVYSAEWIYMHNPEDYLNEGLSFDEVKERLTKMEELPFTEEALDALREKKAYLEAAPENESGTVRKKEMPEPFDEKESGDLVHDFYSGYTFSFGNIESTVNDYALFYKENIYTGEWLYEHSISDYIEEGLPLEDIAAKLSKMEDFPFTEEARNALKEKAELVRKISSYSLETAVPEELETVIVTEAPEIVENVPTTIAP